MRYIPNNAPVREDMLRQMGIPEIGELFRSIPEQLQYKRSLEVPGPLAEDEQLDLFRQLSEKNLDQGHALNSFLGAGAYRHASYLVADSLLQRGEFLTAYTPYQPEISQGTLQAIFEFQTFMTMLTGMEVANASMYDGASACAEAVLMADRLKNGRQRVLLAQSLHPLYREVVRTHTRFMGLELDTLGLEGGGAPGSSGRVDAAALKSALGDDVACVVVQQPNFFGVVEDLAPLAEAAHSAGALLIVVVNEALSLALLEPPGAAGADIVVGEAMSFGVPLYFGGPYLGFMAARDEFKRQLPGRIAGETVDTHGERGFVLTLATREQHIRREKATSNICTNQNLVMLTALINLTLLGREGLLETGRRNVSHLGYFRGGLAGLTGYRETFGGPVFNEITLTCPRPAADIVHGCLKRGVLPGLDAARLLKPGGGPPDADRLLVVAITETSRREEIDALLAALREEGK
ncbi:MAG: aminomethyl-transferring glycine dehydrogenase subunit GcvPA [Deltaproteobacteria bacterium]|nr:aminomethyl-transferring glycine dehydrogenase subunit GcvPA [Deltaproteobacteria bacterium]